MTVTVTVGGEELRLVRPRGRAGRRFVAKAQAVMGMLSPLASSFSDENRDSMTPEQMNDLFRISSQLFDNDELKFEEEILTGLYIWSEAGLSREEAIEKLDESADTPLDMTIAFLSAAAFWINPPEEEKEAFEEAVKKSQTEEVEES